MARPRPGPSNGATAEPLSSQRAGKGHSCETAERTLSNACAGRARIAIIGGENVGKRFIDWNFVSHRKERTDQARDDWTERRFPTVAGDDIEFIPLSQ